VRKNIQRGFSRPAGLPAGHFVSEYKHIESQPQYNALPLLWFACRHPQPAR
jgi:hypothetical protein